MSITASIAKLYFRGRIGYSTAFHRLTAAGMRPYEATSLLEG